MGTLIWLCALIATSSSNWTGNCVIGRTAISSNADFLLKTEKQTKLNTGLQTKLNIWHDIFAIMKIVFSDVSVVIEYDGINFHSSKDQRPGPGPSAKFCHPLP